MDAIEQALAPALAALTGVAGLAATYRAVRKGREREPRRRYRPVAVRAQGERLKQGRPRT